MDQLSRYHQNRSILIAEMGGECVRCGTTERLEFDHIDPDQKLFNISKKFNLSLDYVREEAKKCQLLCRACHKAKSAEESSLRNLGNPFNQGSSHPSSKFSNEEVEIVRVLLSCGYSQRYVAKLFDVNHVTIGNIDRGATKY